MMTGCSDDNGGAGGHAAAAGAIEHATEGSSAPPGAAAVDELPSRCSDVRQHVAGGVPLPAASCCLLPHQLPLLHTPLHHPLHPPLFPFLNNFLLLHRFLLRLRSNNNPNPQSSAGASGGDLAAPTASSASSYAQRQIVAGGQISPPMVARRRKNCLMSIDALIGGGDVDRGQQDDAHGHHLDYGSLGLCSSNSQQQQLPNRTMVPPQNGLGESGLEIAGGNVKKRAKVGPEPEAMLSTNGAKQEQKQSKRRQRVGTASTQKTCFGLTPEEKAQIGATGAAASAGFGCPRCGKVFSYEYYRDKHLKYTRCVDNGQRRFRCALCPRSFEKRDRLRIHVLHVHERFRPHVCPLCPKAFSQSSSLNKHLRTHSGERPYECPHCEKAFTASSILRTHIRQHSGEKPFKCADCGKSFASHAAHDSHARRSHQQQHQ